MATTVFTAAQMRSGREQLTPWVEFTLVPYPTATATVYKWGRRDDSDVANYSDFKRDQVESFGRILRSLSGADGQLQASNFAFSIADSASPISGIGSLAQNLNHDNFRYWYNRIVRLLIIGSSGRAAVDDPRVLFRGYVTSYGSRDGFIYDFSADDALTSEFSPFNPARKLPSRLIGSAQFSDCPAENLGLPEPIGYGEITDTPDGTDKGAIPVTYVGTEVISSVIWHRFLVFGHASLGITDTYTGGVKITSGQYGVDVLAPGKPSWPFGTLYRDIGGRRYTLIYAKGAIADAAIAKTAILTVNAYGAETVGDGTGTLIDATSQAYKHFMITYVFNNYETGAYPSNPIWSPAEPTIFKVNTASFDALELLHQARLAFPYYRVGGVLGLNGQVSIPEAIKDWNLSNDCQCSFDASQQFYVCADDNLTPAMDISEADDIIVRPLGLQPDTSRIFNEIPYTWKESYTEFQSGRSSGRRNSGSIDAHASATRRDSELRIKWVRDDATAQSIADYRSRRYRAAPHLSRLTLPLYGIHIELGQCVRVTHSKYGWNLRTFRVEQLEINLDDLTVDWIVRDMTAPVISTTTTTFAYNSRTGSSAGIAFEGGGIEAIAVAFSNPSPTGGSDIAGVKPSAGTYVDVPMPLDITINWDVVTVGNLSVDVYAWTENSGTSCTPNVRNTTDNSDNIGASTTSLTPAKQTIIVPRPGGGGVKTYRLRVTRGANTNAAVGAYGVWKIA